MKSFICPNCLQMFTTEYWDIMTKEKYEDVPSISSEDKDKYNYICPGCEKEIDGYETTEK